MYIEDIEQFESSFKLQFIKDKNWRPESLTNLEFLKPQHIVFVGDLKFWSKFEKNYSNELENTLGLICTQKFFDRWEEKSKWKDKFTFIATVDDINLSMGRISKPFFEKKYKEIEGLSPQIGNGTIVHSGATLMPGCKVGENCEIFPGSIIYPFVEIENNVRIHGGSVIGADGFGYNFNQGVHEKVWHFGGVKIQNNVEIGANSCIDGGTFSPTTIGAGSKIDNHVQIGHNCQFGKGVIICGHCAIGGSTSIGDFSVMGGKGGAGHGLNIGAQCQIAGGALVNCDWPDKAVIAGHPARPLKEWLKGVAFVRKMSLGRQSK